MGFPGEETHLYETSHLATNQGGESARRDVVVIILRAEAAQALVESDLRVCAAAIARAPLLSLPTQLRRIDRHPTPYKD